MRYDLFRFDLGRDPHAPAHAELSVFIVVLVAACGALVATSTLVALTYGWDYRLTVMSAAGLAAALARFGWRELPPGRVADRLALAFAGTFAAALFCTYASDWLDWQPLDIDDAVAGLTIGLLLLLAGPARRVLHHAAEVPTAASIAVIALALAPAGWAVFVCGYQRGVLGATTSYALIEAPGLAAALGVTALGFWFALRRHLYAAAMALSPVAWLETTILIADGGAPPAVAVLVGGIVGTALMIASVHAWVRSARNAGGRLGRIPASVLVARAKPLLAGPARRALRVATCASNAGTLAGLVALGFLVAVSVGVLDDIHRELARAIEDALLGSPGREIALAVTVLVFVPALRQRLHRTAALASAALGVSLLFFHIPYKYGVADTTALALAGTLAAGPLLAARAAWRASATGAPARPGELLLLLALASAVAFMADLRPIDYFLAAATLGVWWWFYYRRGTPLVAPGAVERLGRRQPLLRLALAAALGVTVGAHGLLLQAAVEDRTGAMVLVELRKGFLYRVSDATFARAMLRDQYLWRDELVVSRRFGSEASPSVLVEASRHPRDQWSGAGELFWIRLREMLETSAGYGGVDAREVPGGRLVSYVHGGSPAQRAGVRRGDLIRAVNGVALARPDATWEPSPSMRLELVSATGELREVTVAQAEYQPSAIGAERIIDAAGRKVGYLELHNFGKTADRDFLYASIRLGARGIDELVLDLRMNPGGSLRTAVRVAGAIGGKRLEGRTFGRLVHNERYRDLDRDLTFRRELPGALSLSRIFIITSEDSCSASELLINGLAPHMEVVTIGGTTCGKPVGSTVLEYGEHEYSVINFGVINARGEGDYYNGLRPTCGAENDVWRDFGDPEEASLKAALHYIRHGRCPEPSVWL